VFIRGDITGRDGPSARNDHSASEVWRARTDGARNETDAGKHDESPSTQDDDSDPTQHESARTDALDRTDDAVFAARYDYAESVELAPTDDRTVHRYDARSAEHARNGPT
jgi:hypothetical protein